MMRTELPLLLVNSQPHKATDKSPKDKPCLFHKFSLGVSSVHSAQTRRALDAALDDVKAQQQDVEDLCPTTAPNRN